MTSHTSEESFDQGSIWLAKQSNITSLRHNSSHISFELLVRNQCHPITLTLDGYGLIFDDLMRNSEQLWPGAPREAAPWQALMALVEEYADTSDGTGVKLAHEGFQFATASSDADVDLNDLGVSSGSWVLKSSLSRQHLPPK